MSPREKSPLVILVEAQLREAAQRRREANKNYETCIKNAVAVGMSNIKIASVVGVTEAAIRNWRKRH